MNDTKSSRDSPVVRRLSLAMVYLSTIFLVISFPFWLPFSLGEEFPNCLSARFDSEYFAVGAMSQHRMSSLFITRLYLEPGKKIWSERGDFHFCTFAIPPSPMFAEPPGFNISLNSLTIGWDLPYLIMLLLWSCLLYKSCSTKFYIGDLFGLILLTAILIWLVQMRIALLLTVAMNLLTAGLVVYLIYRGILLLWSANLHKSKQIAT